MISIPVYYMPFARSQVIYYGNSYSKIGAIFMPIFKENGFCFL